MNPKKMIGDFVDPYGIVERPPARWWCEYISASNAVVDAYLAKGWEPFAAMKNVLVVRYFGVEKP